MKKKLYEAIARYYGEDKDPVGVGEPYRVMLLPRGMLGADGIVVSSVIDNTIGDAFDTNITYYQPENTVRSITDTIKDFLNDLEKTNFNPAENYISILVLGLNPPNPAVIDAINEKNYVIQYIYVKPEFYRKQYHTGKRATILPSGYAINSVFSKCNGSSTPAEVLYKFLQQYAKANNLPGSNGYNDIFPTLTEFVNGAEFYGDGGLRVDLNFRTPEFVSSIDRYTGTAKTDFTVPRWAVFSSSLIHRMYYNWCMRQENPLSTYRSIMMDHIANNVPFVNTELKTLIMNVANVDPKKKYDIIDFEEKYGSYERATEQVASRVISEYEASLENVLTEEFAILQNSFKTIYDSLRMVTKKPPVIGKLDDMSFMLPVPVIVAFEKSLSDTVPYETEILRYILGNGAVRTSYMPIGDYGFMCLTSENIIRVGTGKGKNMQRINAIIKHDPETHDAFALCYDDDVAKTICRAASDKDGYHVTGKRINLCVGGYLEVTITKTKGK